jgi:hypothetical protein
LNFKWNSISKNIIKANIRSTPLIYNSKKNKFNGKINLFKISISPSFLDTFKEIKWIKFYFYQICKFNKTLTLDQDQGFKNLIGNWFHET